MIGEILHLFRPRRQGVHVFGPRLRGVHVLWLSRQRIDSVFSAIFAFTSFCTFCSLTSIGIAQSRARARDLGIAPGVFTPGPLNAITDVGDVRVVHTTIVEGDSVRTGVTAIVPHGGNVFQEKVAGAVFVGNAFGKLAGSTQVTELGTIETPIVLTNTLSVGVAVDAVVRYTLAQRGNEQVRSVNALDGETNDGADCTSRRSTCSTRLRTRRRVRLPKAPSVREPARSATAGRAASARRRESWRRAANRRQLTPWAFWRRPTSAAT